MKIGPLILNEYGKQIDDSILSLHFLDGVGGFVPSISAQKILHKG